MNDLDFWLGYFIGQIIVLVATPIVTIAALLAVFLPDD